MARNLRTFRCSPEAVFEVLSDGWLYPSWVVGASRMRTVDETWPEEGSRLGHSVGTWPFVLNDSTSVREWDPPNRMVLLARGWPIGEASVHITVERTDDGCVVRMVEEVVSGPARHVPSFVEERAIGWRNSETLRRLAWLAEGREQGRQTGE